MHLVIFTLLITLLSTPAIAADDGEGRVPANARASMVTIQPGTFLMGAATEDPAASEDEWPRHEVRIAAPYALSVRQVTRGEFVTFVSATGYAMESGCWTRTEAGWRIDPDANWLSPGYEQTDDHPVTCISRKDALAYLVWRSGLDGVAYRLPSEAEWDFAQRSGGHAPWTSSYDICLYGNVNDITAKNKVAKAAENCTDGFLFTSPVATFKPNGNGLYDMVGNLWEWTADCALGAYENGPTDGTAAVRPHCLEYVLRGHSWTDAPGPVRLETRFFLPDDARQSIVGFRLASDQPAEPVQP